MSKKIKPRTYDELLKELRTLHFDVHGVPGVANQSRVAKYGCATVLTRTPEGLAMAQRPGVVVGGEIAQLLDRGFQKFFATPRVEVPATADHLRSLHRFTEELKEVTRSITLYNESLGTVSDEYMYDRVKGRDLPIAERPVPAWKLPVS